MRKQLRGKVSHQVAGAVVLVDDLAKEEEEDDMARLLQLAHGAGREDGLSAASNSPDVETRAAIAITVLARAGVGVGAGAGAGPSAKDGRPVDPSASSRHVRVQMLHELAAWREKVGWLEPFLQGMESLLDRVAVAGWRRRHRVALYDFERLIRVGIITGHGDSSSHKDDEAAWSRELDAQIMAATRPFYRCLVALACEGWRRASAASPRRPLPNPVSTLPKSVSVESYRDAKQQKTIKLVTAGNEEDDGVFGVAETLGHRFDTRCGYGLERVKPKDLLERCIKTRGFQIRQAHLPSRQQYSIDVVSNSCKKRETKKKVRGSGKWLGEAT